MRLSNVLKHIVSCPSCEVTFVSPPVSGRLGWVGGHLGGVHAAHGHTTVNVGANLIGQVHVEVRQLKNVALSRIRLQVVPNIFLTHIFSNYSFRWR